MGQSNDVIQEQNTNNLDGRDMKGHDKVSTKDDPSADNSNTDKAPATSLSLDQNNHKIKSRNPLRLPVIKNPTCISLMVYGFLHFGGMIGVVVFLPPLLTESFKPADESDAALKAQALRKVTTALAIFGGGGILGDVTLGVILTFGPLATRHFGVFVANNVVMLTFAGNFNNCG